MATLTYDSTYSIALAILNKIKGGDAPVPPGPEPQPIYPEDNQVFYMTLDGAQLENIPNEWGDATIQTISFDAVNEIWVITFNKAVTTMPNGALKSNSYLNFVHLPGSLTAIEGTQFANTPLLEEIWFNGVKADWNSISKSTNWLDSTAKVEQIVCTDEIIPI